MIKTTRIAIACTMWAFASHAAIAQDMASPPAADTMAMPPQGDPNGPPSSANTAESSMMATPAGDPNASPPRSTADASMMAAPAQPDPNAPPPPSAGTAGTSTNPTSFRGFRIEARAGVSRFQSEGNHDNSFTYGGVFGWDGLIGENIVIGPEFSYLRGKGRNCRSDTPGFLFCHSAREQYGVAVRAGVLVGPRLLVFGKGGYVNDRQRRYLINTRLNTITQDKLGTDGYQLGGGVEFSLTNNLYVTGEYVYDKYNNHTLHQTVTGGVGVRF